MAVGINGLACGCNWKCIASATVCAASWSKYARDVSTALGIYSGLLTLSSRLRFRSTPAASQPGRGEARRVQKIVKVDTVACIV